MIPKNIYLEFNEWAANIIAFGDIDEEMTNKIIHAVLQAA